MFFFSVKKALFLETSLNLDTVANMAYIFRLRGPYSICLFVSSWTRITKALGTRLDARLLFLSKLVPTVRENTYGNQ